MPIRDFRLLGASALDSVRVQAAAAVAAWAADWGLGPETWEVRCARPEADLAGVAWDGAWQVGARQLWLACPDSLSPALQLAMFGRGFGLEFGREFGHAGVEPRLAPLAAGRARDALGAVLAAALLGEEGGQPPGPGVAGQPAPHLLARGAGTLCVTLAIGGAECRILLDSASVTLLAPGAWKAQPALAPFRLFKALGATPVRLPVRLGQAELGLSALMSVAVGDVIRLERAADAPVEVLAPGGGAFLRGYPGQLDGMVAVELDGRH